MNWAPSVAAANRKEFLEKIKTLEANAKVDAEIIQSLSDNYEQLSNRFNELYKQIEDMKNGKN